MPYPKFVRLLALGLIAGAIVSPSHAQATTDDEAEPQIQAPPGFVLPPRLRQVAFRDANPWTFHVNARYNSGKPTVKFGDLGNVPTIRNIPGADQTTVAVREYDDGIVGLDQLRTNESDANGNQTSTPGGRYQAESAAGSGIFLDLLSYTPGQTRNWGYAHDSMKVPGGIAMNTFAAESAGASFDAENDGSSLGFEMAVARRVLKLGKKTELNFTASIGLTDLKAERSERVVSNLITMTDVYAVNGAIPDAPYFGPSFDALYDSVGNIIAADGLETTTTLQQITADRTYVTTPNGAFVDGSWKLKGAYYAIRLGPQFRSHLSESLAVTASAGVIGAYVGTTFSAAESLDMGDYEVGAAIRVSETEEFSDLLLGFYGELSVEYWITPRTAFFLGGLYETLDDYTQSVGGRSASVVIGNSFVVRVGIITRF